jgi:hypothetical protein
MKEVDYYSVMRKRIEYFAKKYDPNDKFIVREKIPEKLVIPTAGRIRKKINSGVSYIISMLF